MGVDGDHDNEGIVSSGVQNYPFVKNYTFSEIEHPTGKEETRIRKLRVLFMRPTY